MDLDGYTAIHWQAARPQVLTHGVPKPDHCDYQVVLNLNAAHAQRLAAQLALAKSRDPKVDPKTARDLAARRAASLKRFPNLAGLLGERPTMWPALEQFVHTDAEWQYHRGYDQQHGPARGRTLFLDAEHAIAVVDFSLD